METSIPVTQDAPSPRVTERLRPDADGVARAAELLREGGLVALPTETVYGLAADATSGTAVAGIYAAKERPSFNPLIAHLPDLAAARRQGLFDANALALARAFWPGPLTLVVPVSAGCEVSDLARAGLASVALRVPSHPLAHAILQAAGRPIAAPSANRSGRVSATSAAHVLADLDGRIDAVVTGESTPIGLESTILACLDDRVLLLRPGAITREAAEAVIGRAVEQPQANSDTNPLAPGRLSSHYATRAPLRLDVERILPGEACLAFGPDLPPGIDRSLTLNLSESGDPVEAAANLYAMLRRLDERAPSSIGVVRFSRLGLGEAIFDRLRRAAAPR